MEPKPTLYVETTIPSYLVSRPSKDLVIAGYQVITHEFWHGKRNEYECVASDLVFQECLLGDPVYATLRVEALNGMKTLEETPETLLLADQLKRALGLPKRAVADATHVALAAYHGIKYLVTWNCKHLANPKLAKKMREVCESANCLLPEICTPAQFTEGQ